MINNESAIIMNNKTTILNSISWVFGIAVLAVGVIYTFYGNNPGLGVCLVFLSLIYLPPINDIMKEMLGFVIPATVKIILGIFITWVSSGVGELFNKINLVMMEAILP